LTGFQTLLLNSIKKDRVYRYFIKTDGLQAVLDISYMVCVEDMGDHRLISTPHFDIEVIDTIEDIFDNQKTKFSEN
jgi:hypothetical protein